MVQAKQKKNNGKEREGKMTAKERELVEEIDKSIAYYKSINCLTYPLILLDKIKEYLKDDNKHKGVQDELSV